MSLIRVAYSISVFCWGFSPLLYLFSSTSTWESRCEEKGSSYLFYFQTALAFNCSLLLLATGRFRPETYFCLLKDFFFPVGARNVFLLTKRFVSVGGGRGLRTDTDPQQKLPFFWISCPPNLLPMSDSLQVLPASAALLFEA